MRLSAEKKMLCARDIVRSDFCQFRRTHWMGRSWRPILRRFTWLGPEQNLGAIGAIYNLTMDPFEKYDMAMPASMSARLPKTSPGSWTGQDNAWVLSLVYPVLIDFNKSIMKYPSIKRFPGGASTDLMPNLQNPANPVPAMDPAKPPRISGAAD